MNTAQIIRQALLDVNGVLQNSTTDPFYRLAALLSWATIGKNKAEKALRAAKEDHNFIHLESNDSAFIWCGISYDPAVLKLQDGTRRYTLPPDLLLLKSLRVMDDATESVSFVARDVSHPGFQIDTNDADTEGTQVIYYDVVGENTLILNADPPDDTDIVIEYIPRTGPLQLYTTGTVTLTLNSASVSGGSTAWVAAGLRNNLELIVDTTGGAPKIVSQTSGGIWVDPSVTYYPVSTIDSDGGLTLAAPWPHANLAGASYVLATIPSLPEEHHQSIVDYIAYRALRARKHPAQTGFKADFGNELAEMRADVQPRQEQSPVFVEDWIP